MFLFLHRQTWYNFVVKTSIRRQDALGVRGEFIDWKCIYILFETLLTPNLDVGDNSRLLKWHSTVALHECRGRLCLLVCSISHTDSHMGMSWVRPGSTRTHKHTITKSTDVQTHTHIKYRLSRDQQEACSYNTHKYTVTTKDFMNVMQLR